MNFENLQYLISNCPYSSCGYTQELVSGCIKNNWTKSKINSWNFSNDDIYNDFFPKEAWYIFPKKIKSEISLAQSRIKSEISLAQSRIKSDVKYEIGVLSKTMPTWDGTNLFSCNEDYIIDKIKSTLKNTPVISIDIDADPDGHCFSMIFREDKFYIIDSYIDAENDFHKIYQGNNKKSFERKLNMREFILEDFFDLIIRPTEEKWKKLFLCPRVKLQLNEYGMLNFEVNF